MTNGFKLDSEVVKIQLEGKTKEEVFTEMANMLQDAGYVKESYLNGILKREEVFPTGLPTGDIGVAIPHTDVEHVNMPMVAVATLNEPVQFGIMGGNQEDTIDVKVVFMLAMKDGNAQLQVLQNIMEIIQDEQLLEEISSAQDEQTLLTLLEDKININ